MAKMNERPKFVTTDNDLWNSADEAHFFVTKGMVKPLPEFTTPIVEDALDQGMLREPTPEEMSKHEFTSDMDKALRERRFTAGQNYKQTVKLYQDYLNSLEKVEEPEKEIEKPEIVEPVVKPKVEETKTEEPEIVKPEVKKPEVAEVAEPEIEDSKKSEESEIAKPAESETPVNVEDEWAEINKKGKGKLK